MSLGNFNETNESTENIEKPRNQILETPDGDEDFDSKLDSVENNESNTENGDNAESESEEKDGEKKQGLLGKMLDKMGNVFSRKEQDDELDETTKESEDTKNDNASKKDAFEKSIRVDDSTLDKLDETAKKWRDSDESATDSGEDDDEQKQHGDGGAKTPWDDGR